MRKDIQVAKDTEVEVEETIHAEDAAAEESVPPPAEVQEDVDINLEDPEVHAAATKIQASFRGHMVRKDMKNENDGDEEAVEQAGETPADTEPQFEESEQPAEQTEETPVEATAEDIPAEQTEEQPEDTAVETEPQTEESMEQMGEQPEETVVEQVTEPQTEAVTEAAGGEEKDGDDTPPQVPEGQTQGDDGQGVMLCSVMIFNIIIILSSITQRCSVVL